MAIAYLNHTPIGKATQAQPYTATAHLRYITRREATDYVYSERMPVQWHAAQRWMTDRENAIRKNGRVCDKLIIALPREMSMEQGVDALRDFGWRMSKGKAPFLFSIQDFNSDNPHAHFVYIDASIEDGKRVFRTSDRDSTERIKAIWQDTCNEHLQEMGVDQEIRFGAGEEVANDNDVERRPEEPQSTADITLPEPVERRAPERTETHVEPEPEEDVALPDEEESVVAVIESGAVERHQRILAAVEARAELELLREERNELARLEEAVRSAEHAALDRHTDFNIAAMEQAKVGLAVSKAENDVEASPKGLHLKIGNWEWKSRSRKARERAESVLTSAAYRLSLAAAKTLEANIMAERAAREAVDLAEKRQQVEFHVRTRGTTEELVVAEEVFENTIAENMYGLTIDDVIAEFEAGNLDEDQARQALRVMGKESSLDLVNEMTGFEAES